MFYQTIWYDSEEDQYSECEYEPQYTEKGLETRKCSDENLIKPRRYYYSNNLYSI